MKHLTIRQLKDRAEAIQTAKTIDCKALAAVDNELRLRKAKAKQRANRPSDGQTVRS